jgi:PAS domain-containing protein
MGDPEQTTKQLIHGLSNIRHRIAKLEGKTPDNEGEDLEHTLAKVLDALEIRVAQRTANLQHANQRLQAEISQRQQAEEALRESQERLKAIFETASDAIVTVDLHNVLTSVNRTAETIFGYHRQAMLGQPLAHRSGLCFPRYHRTETVGKTIASGAKNGSDRDAGRWHCT